MRMRKIDGNPANMRIYGVLVLELVLVLVLNRGCVVV